MPDSRCTLRNLNFVVLTIYHVNFHGFFACRSHGSFVIDLAHYVVIQIELRYHRPMFARSPKLIAILCFCLLATQVSGLHLHASLDGNSGLHGTHVHELDPDGHGHDADTDVSFLDSAAGWVKHLPFLVLFIATLFAIVVSGKQVWTPITKTLHSFRHSRWRPPLRAPPHPISQSS